MPNARVAGTVSPSCRQARKGPQAGRRGRCVSRFSSQRGRRGSGRRAVQRDTLSVALRFLACGGEQRSGRVPRGAALPSPRASVELTSTSVCLAGAS